MLNGLAIKKPAVEPPPPERLVLLSDDGTADILPITNKNEERIMAGEEGSIAIPIGDVRKYTGRMGRIYVYPSTVDNIIDCQRIASLEKSTVLRQITQYTPPVEPEQNKSIDMTKILLFILVVVELIIIAAK